MITFPGCKINLGLNVMSKRSDGYHNIESIIYPLKGFTDVVEIIHTDSEGCQFSSSGIAVDCAPDDNLCVKAYSLMQQRYGIGGVKIHLHKNVPFGAGLGGGSADAAAVIKMLNEMFSLSLSRLKMQDLAAELGSDTVFFIADCPALVKGRGEVLLPITFSLRDYYIVVAKPSVCVTTAQAYQNVSPHPSAKALRNIIDGDIKSWRSEIVNDFEKPIFALHPEIEQLKNMLYQQGAIYASMSGSGSAVFGIFDGTCSKKNIISDSIIYQDFM